MLETLFSQFDSLLVLDTETTGINCRTDEIIELAVLQLTQVAGRSAGRRWTSSSVSRRAEGCPR